jgi:hypothetical protein
MLMIFVILNGSHPAARSPRISHPAEEHQNEQCEDNAGLTRLVVQSLGTLLMLFTASPAQAANAGQS